MEKNLVKDLLKGVGVIIDDDVKKIGGSVETMVESIKEAGTALVVYDDIPANTVIDSFGNVSFVILDWDFTASSMKGIQGVFLGDEAKKENKRTILNFLRELLDRVFVPVFIITGQTFSEVEADLIDAGLYDQKQPRRIMLKQKENIKDYETLIISIQEWLEKTPSAYALKIWENEAVNAKNKMFLDLYKASPGWVSVLQDVLKQDSNDNTKSVNHDFGRLLNSIFSNRMDEGKYYDIPKYGGNEPDADEIRRVFQGERYVKYDKNKLPDVSYVGDLYKENGKDVFWVNIRAECDVIREEDPVLYLVKGKDFSASDITSLPRIKMKANNDGGNIMVIDGDDYPMEALQEYNKGDRSAFNNMMQKFERKLLFKDGEIIQKKTHTIITCIADRYVMEFSFRDLKVEKKSILETKCERIGRIIPPYINKIQEEFSSFIVRQGLMPISKKLVISNNQ